MSATLVAPATSAPAHRSLLHNLLLARLVVPTKTPPGPAKLRTDLSRLCDTPLSSEQFAQMQEQLRTDGLITERPLKLTDAGRDAAMKFLNVSSLPPRCNWQTIIAKMLVPQALELDPNSPAAMKKLDSKSLPAYLLQRKENLPPQTPTTINGTLQALACRELGFPNDTCIFDVVATVLNRLIGPDSHMSNAELQTQIPRLLLNVTRGGVAPLRLAVLREWLNGPKPQLEQGLDEFAETVLAVARTCPTGRFGDNKVFISHVWREYCAETHLPQYDLATFKAQLLAANQKNYLTLSRADLVSVMNPDDVRESEINYLNAQYHFLLIEKDRP